MKDDEVPQRGDLTAARPPCKAVADCRILVVEDDESIRQLISSVLARSGYHVDEAIDGAAGWEALEASHYDLLVTDNSMPKVTGIELVKMLRGRGATIPVIMASGAIPTDQLSRNPSLGINVILLKPYSFVELLGAVKEVLHATDVARGHIPPPQNVQSQPSADSVQP